MPVNLEGLVESRRPYEESEKQALIDIFEACGGEEWKQKGWWLKNPEPSTWFGVVVEDGRVTKLMLPGNNLTGSLPDVFAALPQLRVLYLSRNEVWLHGLAAWAGCRSDIRLLRHEIDECTCCPPPP